MRAAPPDAVLLAGGTATGARPTSSACPTCWWRVGRSYPDAPRSSTRATRSAGRPPRATG